MPPLFYKSRPHEKRSNLVSPSVSAYFVQGKQEKRRSDQKRHVVHALVIPPRRADFCAQMLEKSTARKIREVCCSVTVGNKLCCHPEPERRNRNNPVNTVWPWGIRKKDRETEKKMDHLNSNRTSPNCPKVIPAITKENLIQIVRSAGVKEWEDELRVVGSIVISLTRISTDEQSSIELDNNPVIDSIWLSSSLDRKLVAAIMGDLKLHVGRRLRSGMAKIDLLGQGFFELAEDRVKFRALC